MNMTLQDIRQRLFDLRDEQYAAFHRKLIPNIEARRVIGVRTPALRKLAKEVAREPVAADFLNALPHDYYDENQLHAFIVSGIKDFDECMRQTERFLPYVDNWATCDQLSPRVFSKQPEAVLQHAVGWMADEREYTVRFGIGRLMAHFLDDLFDERFPAMVADIRREEYYVRMMQAWYFATALAKQYARVLPFIEARRLEPWTHNKAIQKAVESYRINEEQKAYLKTLKTK